MNLIKIRDEFCAKHEYPVTSGCVVIINGIARCWASNIWNIDNLPSDLTEEDSAFVIVYSGRVFVRNSGIWAIDEMQTAKAGLPNELRRLAAQMHQTGLDMQYVGGFSEIAQHGLELCGAANIALTWANGIEGEE